MSGARALALRLQAPGDFHTHSPPLVSHRFCHFPLLSIRAALSQQEGLCGGEIAEAAGCTEEHGCVPPDRGPLGAPFQEPAQARWHAISQNFFFFCSCDVQSATGEKRRGENLDREQRLTPLRRTSSVGGAGGGCGWGAVSEMATLLPQS